METQKKKELDQRAKRISPVRAPTVGSAPHSQTGSPEDGLSSSYSGSYLLDLLQSVGENLSPTSPKIAPPTDRRLHKVIPSETLHKKKTPVIPSAGSQELFPGSCNVFKAPVAKQKKPAKKIVNLDDVELLDSTVVVRLTLRRM